VVNEGCRVVSEGIVDKPADMDVASVMAMGFPAVKVRAAGEGGEGEIICEPRKENNGCGRG
jgi:hypothetical protein